MNPEHSLALHTLSGEIREREEVLADFRRKIEHALVEAGSELLLQQQAMRIAKAHCPPGLWETWLLKHCNPEPKSKASPQSKSAADRWRLAGIPIMTPQRAARYGHAINSPKDVFNVLCHED